ncbi:hypothetical protein HNQ93_002467 [Hymenobacter luteus]|uniref:Uncharacterized protein n=2 Tax=Hymenobacter TaxID=89966 RepID=A0A7W9T0Z4_9BACT|nr:MULTISPECIES: hypothetical protein [Hymenobacter]MBB4601964.1 hypothetical protein [Hymenobacter latericoloratus]MBB6059607.1 hypothetical protein [Hymenobacter luteus]
MSTTPATQAGRWYAACLYAGFCGWAVVRDVAQPGTTFGGPGRYQQEAAPEAYATHEQAQAAAAALNQPEPSRWDDMQPADWDEDDDTPHDYGRDYAEKLQGDFYSQAYD